MIEAHALYSSRTPIFNVTTEKGVGLSKPNELTRNHILILHGGADISPALYNKPVAPRGGGYYKPSTRDQQEWDFITRAVELGIPIVGICRGAQMLCAKDGGYLVQHINNHAGSGHEIVDAKHSVVLHSNSCHHQMMVPSKHAEILAVSKEPVYGFDEEDRRFTVKEVPEVVYFPKLNAIGIQGHPEWMSNESPFVRYCSELINNLLLRN